MLKKSLLIILKAIKNIIQVYIKHDLLTVDKIIFEKYSFLEFWK